MPTWIWRWNGNIRGWRATVRGLRMWPSSKKKRVGSRPRGRNSIRGIARGQRQEGLREAWDDATELLCAATTTTAATGGWGVGGGIGNAGTPTPAAIGRTEVAASVEGRAGQGWGSAWAGP